MYFQGPVVQPRIARTLSRLYKTSVLNGRNQKIGTIDPDVATKRPTLKKMKSGMILSNNCHKLIFLMLSRDFQYEFPTIALFVDRSDYNEIKRNLVSMFLMT